MLKFWFSVGIAVSLAVGTQAAVPVPPPFPVFGPPLPPPHLRPFDPNHKFFGPLPHLHPMQMPGAFGWSCTSRRPRHSRVHGAHHGNVGTHAAGTYQPGAHHVVHSPHQPVSRHHARPRPHLACYQNDWDPCRYGRCDDPHGGRGFNFGFQMNPPQQMPPPPPPPGSSHSSPIPFLPPSTPPPFIPSPPPPSLAKEEPKKEEKLRVEFLTKQVACNPANGSPTAPQKGWMVFSKEEFSSGTKFKIRLVTAAAGGQTVEKLGARFDRDQGGRLTIAVPPNSAEISVADMTSQDGRNFVTLDAAGGAKTFDLTALPPSDTTLTGDGFQCVATGFTDTP